MIFIDTGAFLARHVARDQYHSQAVEHWQQLRQEGAPCVTSSFVIDETLTLLGRRTSYAFAAERARNLYQSTVLTILRPNESHELDAVRLFEKYADQGVSFTDCVSFALMQEHRIDRVFTFDRHFALAGFHVEP